MPPQSPLRRLARKHLQQHAISAPRRGTEQKKILRSRSTRRATKGAKRYFEPEVPSAPRKGPKDPSIPKYPARHERRQKIRRSRSSQRATKGAKRYFDPEVSSAP